MMKSVYCIQKVITKKIKINDKEDEATRKLLKSLFNRHQNNLETSIRSSINVIK